MLMFLVDPTFQKALAVVMCILIPFLVLCVVAFAFIHTSYTAVSISKLADSHKKYGSSYNF